MNTNIKNHIIDKVRSAKKIPIEASIAFCLAIDGKTISGVIKKNGLDKDNAYKTLRGARSTRAIRKVFVDELGFNPWEE